VGRQSAEEQQQQSRCKCRLSFLARRHLFSVQVSNNCLCSGLLPAIRHLRRSSSAVSHNIFCGSLSMVACNTSSCHCVSIFLASASLRTRDVVSRLWQFPVLEPAILDDLAFVTNGRFTISSPLGANRKLSAGKPDIRCWQGRASHGVHHPVPATPTANWNRRVEAPRFVAGSIFPQP
jgi:hypothetical protein